MNSNFLFSHCVMKDIPQYPHVNFLMHKALFENLHVDSLYFINTMRNKKVEFNPYITKFPLYSLARRT